MDLVRQCHLRAIECKRQEAGLMMVGCVTFSLSQELLGTANSRGMACQSCCVKESSKS